MKTKIPDELKAHLPPTPYNKILGATPVIMTVIATVLAGLSSSEMTSAQYDRSLAAQLQSKAGDQWGLFQAKRLRGALQRSTIDALNGSSEVRPLDGEILRQTIERVSTTDNSEAAQWKTEVVALLNSPEGMASLTLLQKGELPAVPAVSAIDPKVKEAADALDGMRPESEITSLLAKVDGPSLDKTLREAQERAVSFDTAMSPTTKTIERLESMLARGKRISPATSTAMPNDSVNRDFMALRLKYTAVRYDAEARLNQAIATLLELQVRKGNLSADRHHMRSQRFFYGMLAAQMAVVISTLAIAARKRNLLWTIAGSQASGPFRLRPTSILIFESIFGSFRSSLNLNSVRPSPCQVAAEDDSVFGGLITYSRFYPIGFLYTFSMTLNWRHSLWLPHNFTTTGTAKLSVGKKGGQCSGDQSCVMRYDYATAYYDQSSADPNARYGFSDHGAEIDCTESGLCDSSSGTGVNAGNANFGDATRGNCKAQVKIKGF